MNQVQKNLCTNIVNLLTNVLVGLYYTPYLVRELGVAAYGVVPLTLIINQYINVLTGSLTGALSRFYTISLQQQKYKDASKILSTVSIVFLILSLLLIPVLYCLLKNLDVIFTIPEELLESSKWLFFFTISSFFLSLISSGLNITLYAQNRLDLMNLIRIIRIGSKFILIIFLFEAISVDLLYIGLANFLAETIVLILSFYYFFFYSPRGIEVKFKLFDKTVLTGVSGMAFWTIIHQLGDVGLYRVDNIIVNRHWGTELSGALGAISEFGVYVTLIIGVISSLFGPIILIAYSHHKHDEVQKMTLTNSMIVGALTAIMVGCLIGYGQNLLRYWLGDSFVKYTYWFVLKLLPLPFFAAAGIYAFVNRAWNKVKMPAMNTVALGCVNVAILSLFVYRSNSLPLERISWMLLFSAIIIIIQSYGVNAVYFNKAYPRNFRLIIAIFLKILITIIFSFIISKLLLCLYMPSSLTGVLFSLIIAGGVSLLLTIVILFDKNQKQALISIVKK